MDTEEKKKTILEALKSFTKTQLDPGGKGRYILTLERNERVTEKKVNEIYENVLMLQESQAKEEVLDKSVRQTVRQKEPGVLDKSVRQTVRQKSEIVLDKVLDKFQEKLQQLEKSIQNIESSVTLFLVRQKRLEDRIASMENRSLAQEGKHETKEQGKDSQAKKRYGFALVQKSTSSQGKRYQKWYAVKRVQGKQVWVYVGEDVGKADEKIREWMLTHAQ